MSARPPPDRTARLGASAWWGVLRRTVRESGEDRLTDWAAALTYYAMLSVLPGLLVLVSVLALLGAPALQPLIDNMDAIASGPAAELLTEGTHSLADAHGYAGILAAAGVAGTLWAASGYTAAFMRAANTVYDVPEGRPAWKTVPIRLGVTVVVGLLLAVSALTVVLTGDLARRVGEAFGVGPAPVTVWEIVKWPILVGIVSQLFALLYWASPNARQGGYRWVSPGGLLAVALWMLASAGFAAYIANLDPFNRTYGVLGAVIIFYVWLWTSNLAVLVGAEFDAELHRARAIAAGHPVDSEPYVELRDTRKLRPVDDDADLG
ncbi:YihY/virulence factor BrkB family protein [Phytohabitans kaempferiae]|uniref:YihY/virulence factor BrkB family protein n=1 Tax=Phytohabitans kaempferiae TaxID=1620943 RepID=A0ABV6MGI9_9ACTN